MTKSGNSLYFDYHQIGGNCSVFIVPRVKVNQIYSSVCTESRAPRKIYTLRLLRCLAPTLFHISSHCYEARLFGGNQSIAKKEPMCALESRMQTGVDGVPMFEKERMKDTYKTHT